MNKDKSIKKNYLFFTFFFAFFININFVFAQLPYLIVKENFYLKQTIINNNFYLPYESFKYHFLNDTLPEMKFFIFKNVPSPGPRNPIGIKEAYFGTVGFNWNTPKYYGEQSSSAVLFSKLLKFIPIPKISLPKLFPSVK